MTPLEAMASLQRTLDLNASGKGGTINYHAVKVLLRAYKACLARLPQS